MAAKKSTNRPPAKKESPKVKHEAAIGLKKPAALTKKESQSLAGEVLRQAPSKPKGKKR